MQKCNPLSLSANSRRFIDQSDTAPSTSLECRIKISDGEADVMNPGPSPREKFSNRRRFVVCFEKLYKRSAGIHSGYPRTVGFGKLHFGQAEYLLVERQRFCDRPNCDPDVRNSRALGG